VAYFVIPALGGTERKIGDAYGQRVLGERGVGRCIDWSLDGKYLIVADKMTREDSRPSILLLAVEDGQRKGAGVPTGPVCRHANSLPGWKSGCLCAGIRFSGGDIHVVPTSGGEPRRVTSDGRFLNGLAWTADGKEIVSPQIVAGYSGCGASPCQAARRKPLNGVGEGVSSPSIAAKGDRLAYVNDRVDANLWRMPDSVGMGAGRLLQR